MYRLIHLARAHTVQLGLVPSLCHVPVIVTTPYIVHCHIDQHVRCRLVDKGTLQTGADIREGIVGHLDNCITWVEVEGATDTKVRAHIGEKGIGDIGTEGARGHFDKTTTFLILQADVNFEGSGLGHLIVRAGVIGIYSFNMKF